MRTKTKCVLSVFLSLIMILSALPYSAVQAVAASVSSINSIKQYTNGDYNTSKIYYSGSDLGATYTAERTTFKVWSLKASKATVNIYTHGSKSEGSTSPIKTLEMTKNTTTGVWTAVYDGDHKNEFYTYSFEFANGQKENDVMDIYAKAAGVNGNRAMIVDLDSTDPVGWENDSHICIDSLTDNVIWEVSINDFSADPSSGISKANRGKYLAFTESGTTVNNEGYFATGVDYLKQQGITAVQIMPMFDYDDLDESVTGNYNWGYNPKNYNVPEGSYSSNPFDGNVRINEVKQLVQALHNAGISVIMDVVYNHTYATTDSAFERTDPGYFYRMSGSTFLNSSGCGNVTASNHAMFRKYMIESVLYWTQEYHIDGFRFDLMGCHDIETMRQIRAELNKLDNGSKIIMYGEPWTANIEQNGISNSSAAIMDNMQNTSMAGIGAFNDQYRRALKGDNDDASKGFIQGSCADSNELVSGITGNTSATWGNVKFSSPTQAIQYVSCHDNLSLWDKIVISLGGSDYTNFTSTNYNAINRLAASLVLTASGIPFAQAGEEFNRTKYGDSNSYSSSISINSIKWSQLNSTKSGYNIARNRLTDYYEGLIEIRKAFPKFGSVGNSDDLYVSITDNNCIGYTISSPGNGTWDTVAVLSNSSSTAKNVKITSKYTVPTSWTVISDGNKAGLSRLGTKTGTTISVPARTKYILVDTTSFNREKISNGKGVVTIEDYDIETGDLLATRTKSGKIGDSYITNKNTSEQMLLDYDYVSVDSAESGVFTQEGTTVKYYYKSYSGDQSAINVKYKNTNGTVLGTQTYIGREGWEYNVDVKNFDNYTLDLEKSASVLGNLSGVFTAEDKTITLTYKSITPDPLVMHFYTDNFDWNNPHAWLYNNTTTPITHYFGVSDWIANMSNDSAKFLIEEQTDEYIMYKLSTTFKDDNMQLIIHQPDPDVGVENVWKQPGNEGYYVMGEVWIKSGKVWYDSDVTVTCVDTNGNNLLTQSYIAPMVSDTTEYNISAPTIDGYDIVGTQAIKTGCYSMKSPVNVVFVYDVDEFTEPELKPIYKNLVLGDLNANKIVNMQDAYFLYLYCIGNRNLVQRFICSADTDNDNDADLTDLQRMLDYLSAKRSTLHDKLQLNVTAEDSELGSIVDADGNAIVNGLYDKNTDVTINAIPAENYEFCGWYKNGKRYSMINPLNFGLFQDTVLTARFAKNAYYVHLTAEQGGTLSDSTYETTQSVQRNTIVEVTAIPDTGYHFVGWYDTETDKLITTNANISLSVNDDIDYYAVFSDKYSVKVSAEAGGTANASQSSVTSGTSVKFTAAANSGYSFAGWYDGSTLVSNSNPYTLAITEDTALTAKFTRTSSIVRFTDVHGWSKVMVYAWNPKTQVANSIWGKSPTMELYETNDYGQSVYQYEITGDYDMLIFYYGNNTSQQTVDIAFLDGTGYYLTGETDSYGKYEVGTWKFSTTSLVDISTSSAVNIYSVQAVAETGGKAEITKIALDDSVISGTDLTSVKVDENSTVTFTATPDSGYTFSGWYESNTKVSSSKSYKATISKDTKLTAKFIKSSTSATTKTVYFTNNKGWSIPRIYVWSSTTGTANSTWSASPLMTYVKTNDYGEDVYKYSVKSTYDMAIFLNNDRTVQTVDIMIKDDTGYYPDVISDGKYTVGTYSASAI